MKVVVLDGYCLNPGDLSWDALRRFGELVVFERTRPEQVVERAAGAEIALTNKTPIPGSVLAELPALASVIGNASAFADALPRSGFPGRLD